MVQFESMCPNWLLNWTSRLQSQMELGWGSSLARGKPQNQKNQKPQKNVQFRSMCPNMVEFRSVYPNWALDWTVRLQCQTGLGWGENHNIKKKSLAPSLGLC